MSKLLSMLFSNKTRAVLGAGVLVLVAMVLIAPAVKASTPQDVGTTLQLLKPKDGKVMRTSTPIFSWTPLPNAPDYYVEIAADPAFDPEVVQAFNATAIQPYTQASPLAPGTYFWRVITYDYAAGEQVNSEVRSFKIHPNADPDPQECAAESNNEYKSVPVEQVDLDDPVRPAAENADKNAALRGFSYVGQPRELVDFYSLTDGASGSRKPPQIATMFQPARVPTILETDQMGDWTFLPSPDPGYSNSTMYNVAVHLIGLDPAGFFVSLRSPAHGRSLGSGLGHGTVVLYADETSVTLKFTREDSVATGYTMHIMGICTDPNLLALYQFLDNADRNSFGPSSDNVPQDGQFDYSLPGLKEDQEFGTSYFNFPVWVAIRDVGTFLDPRSKTEWWQIHPGN